MGIDAMNALSVVTYEMDQMLGTDTNKNFLKYLRYWQDNDISANCAQTDTKGDRLKRPHEQVHPDLYLRIVESRPDGIVVRGAKIDNTTAPVSDEIVAIPVRFMTDRDNDYAVAFAIPADWEGVKMLVRPAYLHKTKYLHSPVEGIGDAESFTIFDDVFVPRERGFLMAKVTPDKHHSLVSSPCSLPTTTVIHTPDVSPPYRKFEPVLQRSWQNTMELKRQRL
jgi:4-hydroxyphenylacetate 3-monooxygenase/4-hydroxybutyryl-CoA dehydratase/vinylacetyl-CoA-Delta-isomerase